MINKLRPFSLLSNKTKERPIQHTWHPGQAAGGGRVHVTLRALEFQSSLD